MGSAGDARLIWQAEGVRLSMIEKPNGDVALVRATDFDSGPAQSLIVPDRAVGTLISTLLCRQMDQLLGRLAPAQAVGPTASEREEKPR